MNQHVNTISGRLSLRQPQRDSLEILARITEIISLDKDRDLAADLAVIQSEFPTVTDFERYGGRLCEGTRGCDPGEFQCRELQ